MESELQQSYQSEDSSGFDFKMEFFKYLRYWPWFLVSLLFFLTASFLYLRYTPKTYSTSAKIKILDEGGGLELPTSALVINRSNINLQNETVLLTSFRILESVVDELNLTAVFTKMGSIKSNRIHKLPFQYFQKTSIDSLDISFSYELEINNNGLLITRSDGEVFEAPDFKTINIAHSLPFEIILDTNIQVMKGKRFGISYISKRNAIDRLKSSIQILPIMGSHILELNIVGKNKLLSQKILNMLITVFNEDDINDRQSIWRRTISFINERFVGLSDELDSIEDSRKDFKKKHNLIDIPSDAGLSLQNRVQSDSEVYQTENQIAVSEFIKEDLSGSTNSIEFLPANIGIENASINSLILDYNKLVSQRDDIINSAGLNNPTVQGLESKLKSGKTSIIASLDSYINQLKMSKEQFQIRNRQFRSDVSKVPLKEQQLRAIERQQTIKETLFIFLLKKNEEASINLAVTEPTLKVVEYAISKHSPIAPQSNIIYLASILFGLILPFAVVYVSFLLDTKIQGKQDLAKLATEIPVIAEIPQIKSGVNLYFSDPNDRSTLAEAFRILTTNMNHVLPKGNDAKVIFCTSTIKGEGKTFISLNLSLAMASLNKKVLLIGADLRNPQIHTYAKVNKNSLGVSNYLSDPSIDWKSLAENVFSQHANHKILFSGSIPPNPVHLLANGNFEKLLEEAKAIYDFVIVDLAPTILVTDTLIVSHLADATICAVRANHTDKNIIPFSVNLHKTNRLKNMVYVINGIDTNKGSGYSYNYGYNYGYDYGYKES